MKTHNLVKSKGKRLDNGEWVTGRPIMMGDVAFIYTGKNTIVNYYSNHGLSVTEPEKYPVDPKSIEEIRE